MVFEGDGPLANPMDAIVVHCNFSHLSCRSSFLSFSASFIILFFLPDLLTLESGIEVDSTYERAEPLGFEVSITKYEFTTVIITVSPSTDRSVARVPSIDQLWRH